MGPPLHLVDLLEVQGQDGLVFERPGGIFAVDGVGEGSLVRVRTSLLWGVGGMSE